jgi:hypothetical protein
MISFGVLFIHLFSIPFQIVDMTYNNFFARSTEISLHCDRILHHFPPMGSFSLTLNVAEPSLDFFLCEPIDRNDLGRAR